MAKVDGGGVFDDIASSTGRMGGLVQVQQSGDGRKTDAATSPGPFHPSCIIENETNLKPPYSNRTNNTH